MKTQSEAAWPQALQMCRAGRVFGVSNFAAPVKTFFWNQAQILLAARRAENRAVCDGGFEEIRQTKLIGQVVYGRKEPVSAAGIGRADRRPGQDAL
jgi:hypothetical protein